MKIPVSFKEVLRKAKKCINPVEKLTPSQWADKYRVLSNEASAEPGRWRTSRAEYQRGMLDIAADKSVKQIVVMSSAQIGKSEILLCLLGYFLDYEPCPVLVMQPSLEMAEDFSKTRLAPLFRLCPVFRGKIKDPRSRDSGNTLLLKQLSNGGRVALAGSNSPASLASRPIRIVMPDEIDRYPASAGTEGDPVDLALTRTATFWNSLSILTSTPTIKGESRIEKAFLQSDQRHYYVSCIHCGYEQYLKWDNLQYEGKGTEDFKIDTLEYICESCGAGIPENQKLKMINSGKWKAHAPFNGVAGFHLNQLYSPWRLWTDIALEFESARDDPERYKVWYNTRLGLPLEAETRVRFEWENLLARAETSNYSLGQIPEGALFLTAGVDVQGDRLEVAVFGWGDGEECFLIDYHQILGDTLNPSVWMQLEAFLEKDYPHPLGAKIKVRRSFIDTGFSTQEVYQEVLKRRSWFAIKGKSGDRPLVSTPSLQEVNYAGKKITRGISLYILGVDVAKSVLLSRCKISQPGAKYLNVPQDITKAWCQGFAGSEVMLKKYKNKQPYYVWEPVSNIRNEPLDTIVYAYCCAIMAGITRMNFEALKIRMTVEKDNSIVENTTITEPVKPPVKPPNKPPKRPRNPPKTWGR